MKSSYPRFAAAGATATAYVDSLYLSLLGRPADDEGRAFWAAALEDGMSREALILTILRSDEAARRVVARAYLDIVRLRLGDRLSVRTEVPPQAATLRMPPMMLLPLIDHAIVRGLEPATAGGTISITASVVSGRLRVTIADSGAGFVPEGDGDGLAAIRERLEALYRGDATLDLRRRGSDATVAALDAIPSGRWRKLIVTACALLFVWSWSSRFVVRPFHDTDWPAWAARLTTPPPIPPARP